MNNTSKVNLGQFERIQQLWCQRHLNLLFMSDEATPYYVIYTSIETFLHTHCDSCIQEFGMGNNAIDCDVLFLVIQSHTNNPICCELGDDIIKEMIESSNEVNSDCKDQDDKLRSVTSNIRGN